MPLAWINLYLLYEHNTHLDGMMCDPTTNYISSCRTMLSPPLKVVIFIAQTSWMHLYSKWTQLYKAHTQWFKNEWSVCCASPPQKGLNTLGKSALPGGHVPLKMSSSQLYETRTLIYETRTLIFELGRVTRPKFRMGSNQFVQTWILNWTRPKKNPKLGRVWWNQRQCSQLL